MAQSGNAGNAKKVLRRLDDQHNKYKFMELNLIAKRKRYAVKLSWYFAKHDYNYSK